MPESEQASEVEWWLHGEILPHTSLSLSNVGIIITRVTIYCGLCFKWRLCDLPSLESISTAQLTLYVLLPGFPDYPVLSEVEATFGNISDAIPPVAWSSLQMVYRVLLTHHQAIAICESAQTSWLYGTWGWERNLF